MASSKGIILGGLATVVVAGAAASAYYYFSTPASVTNSSSVASTNTVNTNDVPEVGVVPTSGLWDFTLTASTGYLSGECASLSGGFATGGEARLSVSDDGSVAVLNLDEQNVYFFEQTISDASGYSSAMLLFSTPGGGGSVQFDFVANTPSSIVGTIHWNSDDCSGDYPFTMELIEALAPLDTTPPSLAPGNWNLEFSDISNNDCDGAITGFTQLPTGAVTLTQRVDLDTGQPDPNTVDLNNAAGDLTLTRAADSNVYQQTADEIDLGQPVDAAGDVLLDYEDVNSTATINVIAQSDVNATGTLSVTGSNGCSFTVPFVLTVL